MRTLSFMIAGILCFAIPQTSVWGMDKNVFLAKVQEHQKGTLAFPDFLSLCAAELTGDAKDDTDYQSEIYANRALAYLKQNDLEHAKADNAQALTLKPKSARAMFNQGMILAQEGKYIEAYQHMKNTAARAVSNPQMQAAFQKKADEYRERAAISAVALWKAFDENEVAAEDAYKGKPVIVKGVISAITTDVAGRPVVSFQADKTGLATVNCVFSKDARATIAVLKKGQTVLIPGVCDGMLMRQVFVKDCIVD